MILFRVDDPNNGYFPNAGNNAHLVNQVGQSDFKFDSHLFATNVAPTEYTAPVWHVTQTFTDAGGAVVSTVSKDVANVKIASGKILDLGPMMIGSLPMVGVDTNQKSYTHRITVKDDATTLADLVTPYSFNQTDTVFNGPTAPFALPGGGTNDAAQKELTVKEATFATNTATITKAQDENKTLQPRIDRLKALLAPGTTATAPTVPATAKA